MQEGQIKQQKMVWIVPSHAHKIDLSLFRLVNERFLFPFITYDYSYFC